MQELITKLTEKAGISPDQAAKAIDTIKDFVKDKFPMMSGAVDNLFAQSGDAPAQAASQAKTDSGSASMLDKISDFIPGSAGEKAEEIAKNLAGKIGL